MDTEVQASAGEDLEVMWSKGANKAAPTKKALEVTDYADLDVVSMPKGKGADAFPVPSPQDFGSYEYMDTNELSAFVDGVIYQNEAQFKHLTKTKMEVQALWRKSGGTENGQPRRAKVLKPTDLLYHVTNADFIVWFAADHCQKMTRHQMEQLVYRQLLRMGKTKDGERTIKPYDFHGFVAELHKYRADVPELAGIVTSLRQLGFEDVLGEQP